MVKEMDEKEPHGSRLSKLFDSIGEIKVSVGVLITEVKSLISNFNEQKCTCKEYRDSMTKWKEGISVEITQCPEAKKIEEVAKTVSDHTGSMKVWMLFFVVIASIITIVSLMANFYTKTYSEVKTSKTVSK